MDFIQKPLRSSRTSHPSSTSPERGALLAGLLTVALLFPPGGANATEGIEVSRSVVVGGPRVVGLGGAFTAIGEGLGGLMYNSASLGNPLCWREQRWAVDGTLGLSFAPLENSDYENDGFTNDQVERQRSLLVGLRAQIDGGGVGWLRTSRHYSVPVHSPGAGRHEAEFTFVEQLLGIGFTLPRWQLSLGVTAIAEHTLIAATSLDGLFGGLPTGLFNTTVASAELTGNGPFNMTALEIGSLYRPQGEPYRLGASLRITTNQVPTGGRHPEVFSDLQIPPPAVVRSPSLLRLGASYQLGAPYNPPPLWEGGEPGPEERRLLDPELRPVYVLFSTDLVLLPPHLDSDIHFRGPEGFALKRNETAGRKWNAGLHGGVEALLLPGWIRARGGLYFEPSRFSRTPGRLHLTGGFDVTTPHTWILKRLDIEEDLRRWLTVPLMGRFYFDVATHYFSVGLSVGLWR